MHLEAMVVEPPNASLQKTDKYIHVYISQSDTSVFPSCEYLTQIACAVINLIQLNSNSQRIIFAIFSFKSFAIACTLDILIHRIVHMGYFNVTSPFSKTLRKQFVLKN